MAGSCLTWTFEFKCRSTGAEEVISTVSTGKADIGISGLYITRRHYDEVYFSLSHVQDCAVFITLSSTAIPK